MENRPFNQKKTFALLLLLAATPFLISPAQAKQAKKGHPVTKAEKKHKPHKAT